MKSLEVTEMTPITTMIFNFDSGKIIIKIEGEPKTIQEIFDIKMAIDIELRKYERKIG